MGRKATLYISGLSSSTRAKDVAKEFEKFGQLVRCDIPTPGGRSRGYAFIEFQEEREAETAFEKMQNIRIDGRDVKLEWARHEPVSSRRRSPSPRKDRDRERSPRRDRDRSPRRSPPRERARERSPRRDEPRREEKERRRSPSPRREERK